MKKQNVLLFALALVGLTQAASAVYYKPGTAQAKKQQEIAKQTGRATRSMPSPIS